MDRTTTEWKLSLNVRATILAIMLLVVGLGIWEGLNQSPLMGGGAELSEYEVHLPEECIGDAPKKVAMPPKSLLSFWAPGEAMPVPLFRP